MKTVAGFGLFLLGVITGLSCRRLLLETAAADMIYYQLLRIPAPPLPSLLVYWGLPGGALFVLAGYFSGRATALCKALAPLGLLLILWFCYPPFWVLPAGIVTVGWAVLRLGAAGFFNGLKLPTVSGRTATWLTVTFYALAASWGVFTQYHCRETLFLLYDDWGQYFDWYNRLIHGESVPIGEFLVAAGHWNPLPTALMTLLLAAVPLPETLFAANALAVYSTIPLLYVLARRNGWTPGCALWAAAAGFLSPTLSNQCLSLFYGFHPIYFVIPLLLAFFIFQSTGKRHGMIGVFILSLLVQETVPILWAGYGLTLIAQRKWKSGLILFFSMAALFYLLSQQLIPYLAESTSYTQSFHFSELGATPFERMLSPLRRPAAFFGALGKIGNFYLLMTLLAPFFFLALRRWDILLAAGPLLFGLFLRNGDGGINIVRQYALEAGLLVLIAAVLAGRNLAPGNWYCCCAGSIAGRRRGWRRGLAAASIVSLLLGFYCFAKTPYFGKYSFKPLWQQRTHSAALNNLILRLNPGETVATTRRTRGWLLGKCPTRSHLELDTNPECAIVYLTDKSASAEELNTFRRELFSRGYQPVASRNSSGSQFILFRRHAEAPELPFLQTIPTEKFNRIGIPLASNLPDFAIRFLPKPDSPTWTFLIKPLDRKIFDTMITVTLDFNGHPQFWRGYFGHGVIPASLAQPDQTFILQLPRNPASGTPTAITITLTPLS